MRFSNPSFIESRRDAGDIWSLASYRFSNRSSHSRLSSFILASLSIFVLFFTFIFLNNNVNTVSADSQSASSSSSAYTASISNEDSATIPITPTVNQAVYTGTNNITFNSTCPYGAIVSINTDSDSNKLTRIGTDELTKDINPTTGTDTELDNNSWGYSTGTGSSLTYSPVPTLSSPAVIYTSTKAEENKTIPLTFGIKTNNELPSGTYTNNVVYTVTANAGCISYTLKFNLDGGTGASGVDYSDRTLAYGDKINLSSYGTPTKDGFTFAGWTNGTDNFTGQEIGLDPNSEKTEMVTLKAKWNVKTYTITFNANGGSVSPTSKTVNHNSTTTLPTPTYSDHYFAGWYTAASGGSEVPASTKWTSSRTIYAHWLDATVWDFDYTGSEQTWTTPTTGYYQLEVWGARGKSGSGATYGRGGYSTGTKQIQNGTVLYVYVGGAGGVSSTNKAGWNGGGTGGTTSPYGGGGGGATHIALDSGLLSTLSAHATDGRIFIVAGGGGGGGEGSCSGGSGGGTSGGSPGNGYSGAGGTQTSGSAFGKGGNVGGGLAGGGGGGYYGGKGGRKSDGGGNDGCGGGGSGYIGGVSNGNTINGKSSGDALIPNPRGSGNITGNTSHGYARITYLGTSI